MSPELQPEGSEDVLESIDELKERLSSMKRMMAERKSTGGKSQELFDGRTQGMKSASLIDGNFLSFMFAGSLICIVCVSLYAFYNLYNAILKKFPSHHTEL